MAVGLHHDLFAAGMAEFEHLREHLGHVLHRIYVIVVEKDLVQRNLRRMAFNDTTGFGLGSYGHITLSATYRLLLQL
jgi:hypothetical protein